MATLSSENLKAKENEWKAHIKKYSTPSNALAIWTIFSTLGSLVAFGLLFKYLTALAFFQNSIAWWFLTLTLAALNGGVLVRAFIVFHDCCHNSFVKDPIWNKRIGYFFSIVVFTPFEYWRRVHIEHHSHFGNKDILDEADTIMFTLKQYKEMSPGVRFVWRILRDPLVFFTLVPFYPWWVYYPFVIRSPFTILGQAIYLYLAYFHGLWYIPISIWFSDLAGFMLFHWQHAVNVGYRREKDSWSYFAAAMKGSTCILLPKIVRPFTLGIQYHHIHHYQTRVPCYNLEKCHHEAPEGLWSDVTYVTPSKAWESLFNVMYDEENDCFVTFKGVPPGKF